MNNPLKLVSTLRKGSSKEQFSTHTHPVCPSTHVQSNTPLSGGRDTKVLIFNALYFQERRSSELDLYPCEAEGAHSCGHPIGSSHHEGRGQQCGRPPSHAGAHRNNNTQESTQLPGPVLFLNTAPLVSK